MGSGNSFFHVFLEDTVLSIEYRVTVVVFRSESMKAEGRGLPGGLGIWTPPPPGNNRKMIYNLLSVSKKQFCFF